MKPGIFPLATVLIAPLLCSSILQAQQTDQPVDLVKTLGPLIQEIETWGKGNKVLSEEELERLTTLHLSAQCPPRAENEAIRRCRIDFADLNLIASLSHLRPGGDLLYSIEFTSQHFGAINILHIAQLIAGWHNGRGGVCERLIWRNLADHRRTTLILRAAKEDYGGCTPYLHSIDIIVSRAHFSRPIRIE